MTFTGSQNIYLLFTNNEGPNGEPRENSREQSKHAFERGANEDDIWVRWLPYSIQTRDTKQPDKQDLSVRANNLLNVVR